MAATLRNGFTKGIEEEGKDFLEDLMGSVQRWMKDQGAEATDRDSHADFRTKVCFAPGHLDHTPSDHLRCILELVIGNLVSGHIEAEPRQHGQSNAPVCHATGIHHRLALQQSRQRARCCGILVSTIGNTVEKASAEAPLAVRECAVVGFCMTMRETSTKWRTESFCLRAAILVLEAAPWTHSLSFFEQRPRPK